MKLRTKLLLGVGILLLTLAIVMYIVPTFFIRKDVYRAADQIHQLLIEDHQQLIRSQQIWLADILAYIKQNINALLFMFYDIPHFSSQMVFGPDQKEVTVWNALSRATGFDPTIGFIQSHAPQMGKTAALIPHAAQLYPVKNISAAAESLHISLDMQQKGREFIGFPLPQHSPESGFTFFALFEPGQNQEKAKQEISRISPHTTVRQLAPTHQSLIENIGAQNSSAILWAIKIDMIKMLTPLFAESEQKPTGIVRVNPKGEGFALLTEEAFATKPLFDDVLYFNSHKPAAQAPPVANGTILVTRKEDGAAYIGNTMLLDHTYVSIGCPLSLLTQQLALSSNRLILLKAKENFWIGFDGRGNQLDRNTLNTIVNSKELTGNSGTLKIGQQAFYFSRIVTLENDDLVFYDFHPMGGESSIVNTLLSLEDKLTRRISLQLSLISLLTMILVLLFIGRIILTIIHPITQLAQATQDVVAGRYEEVTLPSVGKRRDEVAILTRSFGNMVSGLQEREKIRGVLDKVVSKDVADEILKTQIHLGGEDRIVTMLFSDIREFTTLTSDASPQKTIQMLNQCMTKVSRVIEGEGGVIDKYVGDEVMAIFGAPTSHPDHALRAVSAGMLIVETLKKWNLERVAAGEPPVEMGIGIHTGLVVAGNMGAEDRLNYTVLGTNVNLAARLCEIAKPNQLIISATTLAEPHIASSFYTTPLPAVKPKGFAEAVHIYEITGFKWEEGEG